MDLMSFMAMNPCHDIDNMHTLYMDHSDYHDIMDPCWIIIESLWIIGVDCLHQSMAGRPVCLPGSERGKHWPYLDGCSECSWSEEQYQCVGSWGIPIFGWFSHDFAMVFPWFSWEKWQNGNSVHYRCLAYAGIIVVLLWCVAHRHYLAWSSNGPLW